MVPDARCTSCRPYIVPGLLSPWRAADDEAPDEVARQNLYAGLAWATTLVNLRQPEILAQWLHARGERLWRSRGFLNGLASVIVVALDTTPGDPYVLSFAGTGLTSKTRSATSGAP